MLLVCHSVIFCFQLDSSHVVTICSFLDHQSVLSAQVSKMNLTNFGSVLSWFKGTSKATLSYKRFLTYTLLLCFTQKNPICCCIAVLIFTAYFKNSNRTLNLTNSNSTRNESVLTRHYLHLFRTKIMRNIRFLSQMDTARALQDKVAAHIIENRTKNLPTSLNLKALIHLCALSSYTARCSTDLVVILKESLTSFIRGDSFRVRYFHC